MVKALSDYINVKFVCRYLHYKEKMNHRLNPISQHPHSERGINYGELNI